MSPGERDLSQVYRLKGNIVRREIAGETILVPIRGRTADMQKLFALNPTAAFIWERIDGARDIGQILDDTLAAFEVGRDEAQEHLGEFLEGALANDLIEAVV